MKKNLSFLTQSAIIAALYAATTILPFSLSYEAVQFRFSEALTILPFFTPAAIPGLTVGCIIANLWSRFGVLDIVFGSAATLLAALLTHYCKKIKFGKYIAPFPPVLLNSIIVGALITISILGNQFNINSFKIMFFSNALSVFIGEAVICFGLGLPLIFALNPIKDKIFK